MYLILLYFHHHFIKTFKQLVYIFFLLNHFKCLYSLHAIYVSRLEILYLELGLKNNTKTLSGIGKSSNCMKFCTNQKSWKAWSPAQKFMFSNHYIISCWILKLFSNVFQLHNYKLILKDKIYLSMSVKIGFMYQSLRGKEP